MILAKIQKNSFDNLEKESKKRDSMEGGEVKRKKKSGRDRSRKNDKFGGTHSFSVCLLARKTR